MDRPRVILYALASVDGRLTVAPEALLLHGDDRWSEAVGECHDPYAWLRERFSPQAFLEGSGSFVLADQGPAPLSSFDGDPAEVLHDFLPGAVLDAPGHAGWFVAVDGRGRVAWTIKEWPDPAFAGWHLLVLACLRTPPEYLAFLRREGIPYLLAGESQVDLAAALSKLRLDLGVTTIAATPGGRLGGALLRAGLVDELVIDTFPALVGGTNTPALFTAPDLAPGTALTRLRLLYSGRQDNGHLRAHYEVLST